MQQLVGLRELHITFILLEPVAIPAPHSLCPSRCFYPTRCLYLFPACPILAWIYLHLILRAFYDYRDSLRQPCRELAESVHLNSLSLVFFLASCSGMCLKWDKGGKRAGRVARETFPLTGWMVFIPPSHSRKRVNIGGSESHPSAGPCISYISHLFLTRHKAAEVRSRRNSQCYPR